MIADAPDCHLLRLARLEYEIEEIRLDLTETANNADVSNLAWADTAAELTHMIEWRDAILEEIT